MNEKYLEIKLTKCILFIKEQELRELLFQHPELFAVAIKRGKAILRSRKHAERMTK